MNNCANRDFVVINGPVESLLRPVSEDGRAFIEAYYANWPKGIGQCIALNPSAMKAAKDLITCSGLAVEVL